MTAPDASDDAPPGWRLLHRGKVRRLFESRTGAYDHLLLVADDRISAFDRELDFTVPGKGESLTAQSRWWFDRLNYPDHLVRDATDCAPVPNDLAGRAQIVRRLTMIPVECVVRGHLVGAAWKEYVARSTVAGAPLPPGLAFGDRLPAPVFAPTSKGLPGAPDVPLSASESEALVGDAAARLRDASLLLYYRAAALAADRGLVLLDTKFEFGTDPSDGALTLGDEALTGDSSRYAKAEDWFGGIRDRPLGKQLLRDRLTVSDSNPRPAPVDRDVILRLTASYAELSRMLGVGDPRP